MFWMFMKEFLLQAFLKYFLSSPRGAATLNFHLVIVFPKGLAERIMFLFLSFNFQSTLWQSD